APTATSRGEITVADLWTTGTGCAAAYGSAARRGPPQVVAAPSRVTGSAGLVLVPVPTQVVDLVADLVDQPAAVLALLCLGLLAADVTGCLARGTVVECR